MRVLTTGATGFLGKYLVEELKNNGHEVIAQGRNEKRLNELKETYGIETLCTDLKNTYIPVLYGTFLYHPVKSWQLAYEQLACHGSGGGSALKDFIQKL